MTSAQRFPRPTGVVTGHPFSTAAEAWIWAAQLHARALEGARRGAGHGEPRPCEPGDVVLVAKRLHRARWLTRDQLRILWHYGVLGREPWDDSVFEAADHRLWNAALDRLAPALQRRGFVLPPNPGRFGHAG